MIFYKSKQKKINAMLRSGKFKKNESKIKAKQTNKTKVNVSA